ncbi:alanyl-tRNA editing protein [Vibrio hippocampi]|uniref:Metal-dependent hydrolase n=1 Tax=Vibrio hippocampi TaxID=654686 RepID=A0ABM8ZER0_9VIBR|nr:alanyl-tRNA editing protein [Vibrio hippocampi]CAH0524880.1 hypothetical protein VHP8226_00555 [Vibrio hippocampi]
MIPATKTYFCHQTWQLESEILLIDCHQQYTDIVVAATPFHPISHLWPDHPADRGTLTVNSQSYAVDDCLVGAVETASQALFVGQDIPVKRDSDGWVFVVVHRIQASNQLTVGDAIGLQVDQNFQQALSRGHSAGHIASFALNKVLAANYWRKDADRKDGLGHYDFNSYAQETSFVTANQCVDSYRLGKTLRKRGLNTAEMIEDLAQIEAACNLQLQAWLTNAVPIEMRLEGPYLTSSRYWLCELDEQTVAMPCGGTHASHMAELTGIRIQLSATDSNYIEMLTTVD